MWYFRCSKFNYAIVKNKLTKGFILLSINEQIEKMHKKEDNSSKMSYNGITTNHELRELLSYEYKYT